MEIRLDWDAYWRAFKDLHGGDPVPWNGRLLFRDGWSYSASDPKGPEWPAPEDAEALRMLEVAYWTIRRKIVLAEYGKLFSLCKALREAQSVRSAPLQRSWVTLGEDGKGRMQRGAVDVRTIEEGRLAWLREDLRACEQRLKELDDGRSMRAVQDVV